MIAVLIVDDDDQMRRALGRMARRTAGVHVIQVAGAQDALDAMERSPADFVISDASMPGMSGESLLSVISVRWPRAWRVLCTAYDEHQSPIAHRVLFKDGTTGLGNRLAALLEACAAGNEP